MEFKVVDDYGNYIVGDEETCAGANDMNALAHKGSIHPGEVFTYHVVWQWLFEVDDAQDGYDTYLGNVNGAVIPGVSVGIETQASANPTPAKSNAHMMHLLGEGFGCCWCCYLVWLLLLVCVVLIIWIWRLRRKLNKLEKVVEEYEDKMKLTGNLANQ